MKTIVWEEYIDRENLKTCTLSDLEKEEKEIGFVLPNSLKLLMMAHGGQTPKNLIPKFPNGREMLLECLYHAYGDDKEAYSYTISDSVSCLEDEDYLNYVPFSHVGNVFLSLDYNVRKIDPPVVLVLRDSPPQDPDHRYELADNFDEFLEKYTVPID